MLNEVLFLHYAQTDIFTMLCSELWQVVYWTS